MFWNSLPMSVRQDKDKKKDKDKDKDKDKGLSRHLFRQNARQPHPRPTLLDQGRYLLGSLRLSELELCAGWQC